MIPPQQIDDNHNEKRMIQEKATLLNKVEVNLSHPSDSEEVLSKKQTIKEEEEDAEIRKEIEKAMEVRRACIHKVFYYLFRHSRNSNRNV